MKMRKILCWFLVTGMLFSCEKKTSETDTKLLERSWEEITRQAEGTTVQFMMWQGSPVLNDYINNFVKPELRERYNITLKISGGQGPEIVQLVMGEKEAAVKKGQIDMAWINGETFFQLNEIDGLWGPFLQQIPNIDYVDMDDRFINTDFQQPVNGMECPWGISQFAMVYDSAKIVNPPKNLAQLEQYVKEYPGTFTVSNDFTGMTLLKSFLAELGGSPDSLNGEFDEEKYKRLSQSLWGYLNRNKQYFWKSGTTFPKEQSKMSQLFANGELHINYGFREGAIEERINSGLYSTTTRAYEWENGTIKNANYLGIIHNASNKPGALTVINFLLSPEAQYAKAYKYGNNTNTVLETDRLPAEWKQKFRNAPERQYGPRLEDLEDSAIEEPAPEYMIRLYEDFRKEVIEK